MAIDPVTAATVTVSLVQAIAKLVEILHSPATTADAKEKALASARKMLAACDLDDAEWAALAPKEGNG